MSSKEKKVNFNRNNILNASSKLFHKFGFENVSVDEIAKEALCSKSTIYVYFQSKEEIYNNIVYQGMQKLEKLVKKELSKNISFKKKFINFSFTCADFFEKYPIYFKSLIEEINKFENTNSNILEEIHLVGERIMEQVEQSLITAKKNSEIKYTLPSNEVALILWANLLGVFLFNQNKEQYLLKINKICKKSFLEKSFDQILGSLL